MTARFIEIESRELLRSLKIAIDATDQRGLKILRCVCISADGMCATLSASDIESEVTLDLAVTGGKVAEPWTVCVPAKTLRRIARALAPAEIRIAAREEGEAVEIASIDRSVVFSIETEDYKNWPFAFANRPRLDLIEAFGNGLFADLLGKVAWCMSSEDTRYYLNGVAWQIDSAGRRLVACDGHQLAECRYSPEPAETAVTRIIRRNAVRFVCDHFKGRDIEVFRCGSDAIEIAAAGVSYRTRLIDGTYVDYQRVIPNDDAIKYRFTGIDRPAMLRALTAVEALAPKVRNDTTALRFAPTSGKLTLGYSNPLVGSVVQPTGVEWPPEAAPFGFNFRYIRNVVTNCDGEITLAITDPGAPFVFRDSDPTMTRVVMPMRV